MNHKLFREKSIERVSSPEQLNDYIRVADPGMWLILAGVILVLTGICVWGIFGQLETTLPVAALTEDGQTVCFVKEDDLQQVRPAMEVRAEGGSSTIREISLQPVQVDSTFPDYLCHVGGLSSGEWVYPLLLTEAVGADGSIFEVAIITESVAPVRFVTN